MRFQIAQRSLCVGIVTGEFLVDFVRVAPIRPHLVIWKHGARFFELMKYFGDNDYESVPGQQSSATPNRSGHLKDFGEQYDPWVTAFSDRMQNVGAHWPGWCRDIDEFVVSDNHKVWDWDRARNKSANSDLSEQSQCLDKAVPLD